MSSKTRPFVFRSIPHLHVFQDFTESMPEIAEENDPETAAELYFALFMEADILQPPPKGCMPIPREIVTCGCGKGLMRMSAHVCDDCARASYAPIQELIKQEELEKAARDKKKTTKAKEPPAPKKRAWRPPPAPKVRQTWKKSKKA